MSVESISILGATGSIGESTLDVIDRNRDRFRVVALTAHRNVQKLARQAARFGAGLAVVADPALEGELRAELDTLGCRAETLSGEAGLAAAATHPEADAVMAAIVGAAGLRPTLAAARAGRKVLLANKESLVIAGEVFVAEARRNGAKIIPVDSEHNAIFQSLPVDLGAGLDAAGVETIILTASGGPFLDTPAEELGSVTPEQACKHPNWDMGRKISVDSATLMNKGLEVIEARWLFAARPDQIQVLIHPQSIVHSMVAYRDGSVLAQLGTPDMRTPIANALAWPDRVDAGVEPLDLTRTNDLTFREPDLDRFPCLALAFRAMAAGGNLPVALNAANEVAVESFLQGRIGFDRIPWLVEAVLDATPVAAVSSLGEVLEQDRMARRKAEEFLVKTDG